MKNVIILGAGGNIAGKVIDLLEKKNDVRLTLFLRTASQLRNKKVPGSRMVEGDVLGSRARGWTIRCCARPGLRTWMRWTTRSRTRERRKRGRLSRRKAWRPSLRS